MAALLFGYYLESFLSWIRYVLVLYYTEEVLITVWIHFHPHLFQLKLESSDYRPLLDGVEVRRYHLHWHLLAPASIYLGCVFSVLSVVHLYVR